jgi:mannose-6-phosphate isomerase-like protein (cupin superfamily)
MRTIEVENASRRQNPHGVDVRGLCDTTNAQVAHITLKPGESLKRHITPVSVIFYVLEGNGIVEIGDERKEVGSDTLSESPAGIPNRWLNESGERMRVLVIKTPESK